MSDPTSGDPRAPGRLTLGERRITATRDQALMGAGAPRFSQPVRQILLMLSVLALVMIGGWLTYGRILPIFMANTWLNGLILAVFGVGVLACFWQLAQLESEELGSALFLFYPKNTSVYIGTRSSLSEYLLLNSAFQPLSIY